MDAQSRTPKHPLIAALMERSRKASFHELVRILEALPTLDDAVPVGHQGPPGREGVRFATALDLSFGATEVDSVSIDEETGRYTVTSRFFGIFGSSSPIPTHFTEQLLHDDPDGRLRAFLELFNHRLMSLRHRAWHKYRHSAHYNGRGTDAITKRLRIMTHLDRLGEPLALLGFAGVLHQQPMSAATLENILGTMLSVPVEVHSCFVRWIRIPQHQQNALGQRNATLGGLCALGDQMRSATTTFQVVIGPVGPREFKQFLPNGRRRKQLCDLIDRCNGDQLDCQISVEIDPDAIEPTWLGEASQGLGRNTWLGEDAHHLAPALGDTVSHSLYSPNNDPQVA